MPPTDDDRVLNGERSLPTKDVEAAIRIVSSVCDPQSSATIRERRSELCRCLAEHTSADVWFGAIGVSDVTDPVNSPGLAVYDGGWLSEVERVRCCGVFFDPRLTEMVSRETVRAFETAKTHTFRRQDAFSDKVWNGSPIAKTWNGNGFDHFIMTIHPLPNRYYSVLGLHRRLGKSPFTPRDRTFVHVIWTQTEWLHRQEINFPVGHKVVDLSVRERQVVLLMLGNDSTESAAQKLGLSEHTVGDYLKSIYRKLGVKSRPELIAQFLPS